MIWIAFLFQPFLTLLYALNNYRAPYAKNIMWAFSVFFGMTIALGFESLDMDIVHYIEEVEAMHASGLSFGDWYRYYLSNQSIDVARSILALTIAQFTDNGYFLVVIYGLIFGFFFSRNMWFVIDRLEGKISIITLILLVSLFLVVPLWFLNTFRFWTATHMFIFGLLPYLYTGEKKTLMWCFMAPFIFHFAFILPAIVLGLFILIRPFLKNSIYPFFALFILSIIISEINIEQFNYVVDTYAPEVVAERTKGYRNENYVYRLRNQDGQNSNMVWYAAIYRSALHWSLLALLIVLFVKSRDLIKNDVNFTRVLGFTYLIYAIGNFMSSIPSGGRFIAPAALLATAVITIYVQNIKHGKMMHYATKLTVPLLLLFIIVSLREGLYLTSLTTIVGNPIVALFTIGDNLSLNDVLKSWFR